MEIRNNIPNAGEQRGRITHGELFKIAVFIIIFALLVAVLYTLLLFLNVNKDYASWLTAIVVLVFGVLLSALIARAINEYIKKNGVKQEAGTISRLFSIIAYTTVAIIALYLMHINVTGLLISAGFLGIVLGLAAQSTLSNVFSGISMIIAKPFEPGDYITVQTWQYSRMPSTYPHEEFIPGYNGVVNKIGLLYTEIIENNIPLYVPNSILNQALVINHHRSETRALRFRIELTSDISFAELKRVIRAALKKYNANRGVAIQIEHISQNAYGVSVAYSVKTGKDSGPLDPKIKEAVMEAVLSFISKRKRSVR